MSKVLVIDDERLARITIRKILERAGHDVLEASNGIEGLASFRANGADVVITDIIMPDKEGIETIMELKRDVPGVRVIAISGGGRTRNRDFLKLAQHHGADTVLAKPFSQTNILDALASTMAQG